VSGHRLPRLAVWLHERSLGREDREAVIGDLLEGFASRAMRDPRLARQWVWLQTLRSLAPNLHRRWFVQRPAAIEPLPQGGRIVNGFTTDLRFALRLFRRQPLTSIVAFVSLTAALTLNVLLATLADAALLRQLPLRSPGELVLVLLQRETHINHNFSYLEYGDLRDRARGLESLVAYSGVAATVDGPAGATPVNGEVVSGNFFGALGIRIRTGRSAMPTTGRTRRVPSSSPIGWRASASAATTRWAACCACMARATPSSASPTAGSPGCRLVSVPRSGSRWPMRPRSPEATVCAGRRRGSPWSAACVMGSIEPRRVTSSMPSFGAFAPKPSSRWSRLSSPPAAGVTRTLPRSCRRPSGC
jgi:hypothetical protein